MHILAAYCKIWRSSARVDAVTGLSVGDVLSPEHVRRRVKAARALVGMSVDELAVTINQPGLGVRTLRSLEGDKGRPFRPMELRAIADACELPYEFFTEDLWKLANVAPEKPASQADLDEVRTDLLQIGMVLNDLIETITAGSETAGVTEELAARDTLRSLTKSAVGRLDSVSEGKPAADSLHVESDATTEASRSPDAKTPSGEGHAVQ